MATMCAFAGAEKGGERWSTVAEHCGAELNFL
jgi:hypothetical protein